MRGEKGEEVELASRHDDRLAVEGDVSGRGVDAKSVELEHVRGSLPSRATHQRGDPGCEERWREGLDHVVVGTESEADHSGLDVGLSGSDHDRTGVLPTDVDEKLESTLLRHGEVHDTQVDGASAKEFARLDG